MLLIIYHDNVSSEYTRRRGLYVIILTLMYEQSKKNTCEFNRPIHFFSLLSLNQTLHVSKQRKV